MTEARRLRQEFYHSDRPWVTGGVLLTALLFALAGILVVAMAPEISPNAQSRVGVFGHISNQSVGLLRTFSPDGSRAISSPCDQNASGSTVAADTGVAVTDAANASAGAGVGGLADDHIVLGLRNFGLESTAAKIGGRTLLSDPEWMSSLQTAIANPGSRFTVSLDGLDGSSTYSQVMSAVQNGLTPAATPFNWELAQLYQAERLGDVTFVEGGGESAIAYPFK